MQEIRFSNVERALKEHLSAVIAGTDVFAVRMPKSLPGEYVYIQRTGGAANGLVTERAQITVSCTAPLAERAFELAADVRYAMARLERTHRVGTIPVSRVSEVSAPYSDPDPDALDSFRYSATYELILHASITG